MPSVAPPRPDPAASAAGVATAATATVYIAHGSVAA
ncbi:hypothetical protein FHW15_002716 [Terracoccus luteus]|uniref:Uncharacterized protein n=1 Tax=Terracoccus luteus TaxID=53356 RepID=A0A839PW60_9MICO|nr:hypothetical protein [Terracoccus luteus]MCP2173190.1 hypothetical protein [Terracoccus luteus]